MKNKIKPFIKRLIKENIYYIIGNVFIFILIIITVKIGITEITKYKTKIASLELENIQLMNKVTLMNSSIPVSEKLDEDVKFLNTLIPDVEDYFSIIYALENLSQKSNFIITSYVVNVGTSTSEKLRMKVTGIGDSKSFIDFLKDYNFSGGRLITSDKVQLDPNFSGSIIIDLTFYNKKTEVANKLEKSPNSNIFKELESLKAKVNFSFDNNSGLSSPSLDYPKKSNPF
ncbi:MAG: hypothetical protein UR56_C0026G0004 [Candidatus Roizmanbacteria bacterium GW2011_GWC2_34_23]|uniref:Fimbrial assembly family protein n=1 Tax=Candidatus Roizmanbacteria bacterium GW2011_GWC2_34_23 TaxID=1618484 RepID=A0A0G0B9A8_9BACT|nr:MAG: hypothetical protein UR56_C0026G0004 [Candidatus Roizmanbacteria bacterium GW2011_GWC2_34_23]